MTRAACLRARSVRVCLALLAWHCGEGLSAVTGGRHARGELEPGCEDEYDREVDRVGREHDLHHDVRVRSRGKG